MGEKSSWLRKKVDKHPTWKVLGIRTKIFSTNYCTYHLQYWSERLQSSLTPKILMDPRILRKHHARTLSLQSRKHWPLSQWRIHTLGTSNLLLRNGGSEPTWLSGSSSFLPQQWQTFGRRPDLKLVPLQTRLLIGWHVVPSIFWWVLFILLILSRVPIMIEETL